MTKRRNPFPGVTPVTDRHGKRRYRFRKKGCPSCYLPGNYGSIEFREAYEKALQGRSSVTNPSRLAERGTFNWLIERYLTSPEFEKIGPVYKRNLLYQIDRFR